MKRKLLAILVSIVMLCTMLPLGAVSVSAVTTGTKGKLTYQIENGKVTITRCDPSATDSISIPDEIEDHSVTAIADGAFSDCIHITSVWLPEDISTIGDGAFYGCTSLISVYGDIYGSIGESAFFECSSLNYIDLEHVNTLGEWAFYGCSALTSITFKYNLNTIPTKAFSDCTSLTDVNLGSNITTIDSWAFSGCTGLTYISIPKNVTNISCIAFSQCPSLTDVYYAGTANEIPDGITCIDGAAYHYSTLYGSKGANHWTYYVDQSKLVISGQGGVSGDWTYLKPRYVIIEEGITGVYYTEFASTYGGVFVLSLPSTLTYIGSESFMCGARTIIINGTQGLYAGSDRTGSGYLFFHNTTVLSATEPHDPYDYNYDGIITLNGKMYYASTYTSYGLAYQKHYHNFETFSNGDFTGLMCTYCKMPRDVSDFVCQHEYTYECDKTCAICYVETRPEADHEYFYPCDPVCMKCYEITNPDATHNIVAVEAKEATCSANGNIAYWYCSDCGSAWADEAQTQVTNMMNVVVPTTGEHTYDDESDADCNVCGAIREVEAPETVYGDADGDGEVTSLDVIVLQQHIAGYDVTLDAVSADADGDGEVTSLDVIVLQQYIAGYDVTLGPVKLYNDGQLSKW